MESKKSRIYKAPPGGQRSRESNPVLWHLRDLAACTAAMNVQPPNKPYPNYYVAIRARVACVLTLLHPQAADGMSLRKQMRIREQSARKSHSEPVIQLPGQ